MKIIISELAFLTLVCFYSCHPLKDQDVQDDYRSDLKIQSVRYVFIYPEIKAPENQPRQVIMPVSFDLEFYIIIENIGTADWEGKLCLYYDIDSGWRQDVIRFENMGIPYALNAEVSFKINNLQRRPKSVILEINPSAPDPADSCEFGREAFYNNNIVRIDF